MLRGWLRLPWSPRMACLKLVHGWQDSPGTWSSTSKLMKSWGILRGSESPQRFGIPSEVRNPHRCHESKKNTEVLSVLSCLQEVTILKWSLNNLQRRHVRGWWLRMLVLHWLFGQEAWNQWWLESSRVNSKGTPRPGTLDLFQLHCAYIFSVFSWVSTKHPPLDCSDQFLPFILIKAWTTFIAT